jgi:hypothetical protein
MSEPWASTPLLNFVAKTPISAIFFEKDLETTPLPTYSRGNQLAGLAIFSVVIVAMRGI